MDADPVMTCPNCRLQMPREMRFCRACGFRLGEGVAEFTETVRFEKAMNGEKPHTRTAAPPKWNAAVNIQSIHELGALARDAAQTAIKHATEHLEEKKKHLESQPKKRPTEKPKRRRSNWMGWIIFIIILSVIGSSTGGFIKRSALRQLRDSLRGASSSTSSASRSWVGTSDLRNSEKGVTFDKVEPPGSPADKAGLVGGDLITTFDGQAVTNSGQLMKLLTATPVGKTVEVIYLRDGQTKQTKLVTVSKDELERLEEAADNRTQGYIGIGGSSEHVAIPGTNISGVQLNSIRRNNPAYIAGMRDGDIVIEFDGVPIRTYDELEARTRRAVPDSTVKVVVMRGSERLEIPVKVGEDD
jgi:PDZ domain